MHEHAATDSQSFDPEQVVATYRRVIALRDAEPNDTGKAEFEAIAQRQRESRKNWQGEDSLHEMAFGEPEV